jgi:hypothetical protein
MDKVHTTRRLVSAYAESEPWKIEHDRAMQCRDIEDALIWGERLLRAVSEDEKRYQARAARGERAAGDLIQTQIEESYRILGSAFELVLESAEALNAHGFAVEGLDHFRLVVEEARCLLDSFDIEAEMRPTQELSHLARGCPRPERYGEAPTPVTP